MDGTPTGLDTVPQEPAPPTEYPQIITPKYEGEDPRRKTVGDTTPHTRWRDLPREERNRRTVTTCVIQTWNQHGKLPTVEYICSFKKMHRTDVEQGLRHPQNIADLIQAGVLPDTVESWEQAIGEREPGLTKKQVDAVREYFTLLDDPSKPTIGQALARVGVTTMEWNGWHNDPVFSGYVRDLASRLYGDRQPSMDMALIREAESGDVPALRLAMEVTGRIKQDKNSVDAGMLLGKVMEVIGRHCDRPTQAAIANELALIAGGLRSAQSTASASAPRVIDQGGRFITP